MDRSVIIKQIEQALGNVLERNLAGVSEDARLFDDLHLDSTAVLELLMALEDVSGIEVDPEKLDMDDFKTVGTLTDYVVANLASRA